MNETVRTALVTGASRGIGRAIAAALAGNGCVVAGTATSQAGADAISASFEAKGWNGRGYVLDIGDDESVAAVMDAVTAELGAPLIVVNNAGIARDNLLLRMKPEEWSEVINANLGGAWRISKLALKAMTRARWGRIINVSSVVASLGNPGQTNYAAAKAGLEGFSRSLAREVGSRNITVNTVAPGFIETDMTRKLSAAQQEAMLAQVPLNRLGRPEEIAAMVAFLAGEAGAYITGQTLHVNGGMYLG